MTALVLPEAAHVAATSRLSLEVRDPRQYGHDLRAFLDVIGTATGRATHYNSKDEQVAAELKAHEALFRYDRTLYLLLLTLPGTLDRAMQLGLVRVLADRQNGGALVNVANGEALEEQAIRYLRDNLPVPRMLKTFLMLKEAGVSNQRSRRLVLTALLNRQGLELRAVRYRPKFRDILRHVLGSDRDTGAIRAIVQKDPRTWTEPDQRFFRERLGRYSDSETGYLRDVLCFVLTNARTEYSRQTPLIREYFAARINLEHGPNLPLETLDGIRGQYHKDVPRAKVMEIAAQDPKAAKKNLTKGQKLAVQARAEKAGVTVAFDPNQSDAVKLYVYAYERGLTPEIEAALDRQAATAAAGYPYRYGTVGVLVDASRSMMGSGQQSNRPAAIALATRDMLLRTGERAEVYYAGGRVEGRLVHPEGDTSLADGLVDLLRRGVDIVYVITDGYENSPAGRFAETVRRVRGLGIQTPIVQMSPVLAAEAEGLRSLTNDGDAIPVSEPKALGQKMFLPLLESDPVEVTKMLVGMALGRTNLMLEVK